METHKTEPQPPRTRHSSTLTIVIGVVACGIGIVLVTLAPTPNPVSPEPVPAGEPLPKAWLVNVAPACGIDFVHQSGEGEKKYMPEIMAGGVCLIDYDRDDLLDAYFVQAGNVLGATSDTPSNRLYKNLGDGRFSDVTSETGGADNTFGVGCTVGDFNGDGWPDLYVTNFGPNTLYVNTGAEGKPGFRDVTDAAGVGHPGLGSSAAFVDYDHDGDLDLYVVNYLLWSPGSEVVCSGLSGRTEYCSPMAYKSPAPDVLFRNNGDGTFTDVSETAGMARKFGNGLGVVCADFNGDGRIDIAVANDLQPNQLWINQGDGVFKDLALEQGVAFNGTGMVESGMGIDARDIDYDGDLDLFMTHFNGQTNTLYINVQGFFEDQTIPLGLGSSQPFTGFGTGLVDLNNDGWLDIYVANGRVTLPEGNFLNENDPYADPNQLFEGLPGGGFREVVPRGGTSIPWHHSSRAAAFGDYDNDGDVDILVANRDGPAYVLENIASPQGHWIGFRVLNRHGSDAVGARVEIHGGSQKRVRDVRFASSYCAANDPRAHFGLGTLNHIDRVVVRWTDNTVQNFGPFRVDQYVTLRQEP